MRTTRRERIQRREVALAKVSEGFGFSECVTYVMAQAGCSRATARRDCHWAMDQLAEGLTFSTWWFTSRPASRGSRSKLNKPNNSLPPSAH